jgi:hypothetical protein
LGRQSLAEYAGVESRVILELANRADLVCIRRSAIGSLGPNAPCPCFAPSCVPFPVRRCGGPGLGAAAAGRGGDRAHDRRGAAPCAAGPAGYAWRPVLSPALSEVEGKGEGSARPVPSSWWRRGLIRWWPRSTRPCARAVGCAWPPVLSRACPEQSRRVEGPAGAGPSPCTASPTSNCWLSSARC